MTARTGRVLKSPAKMPTPGVHCKVCSTAMQRVFHPRNRPHGSKTKGATR